MSRDAPRSPGDGEPGWMDKAAALRRDGLLRQAEGGHASRMTDIHVLLDTISVRDERLVRKILETMLEFHMSLPKLLAQVLAIGKYKTGDIYGDTTPFHLQDELFEKALDEYIRMGRLG